MQIKAQFVIVSAISIIIFIANNVQSATYYVSQNGSGPCDQRDGSQSSPWCTIQEAANIVNPGDLVVVLAGNYSRTTIQRSGTSDSMIIFKAESTPDISFPDGSNAYLNNPNDMAVSQGFTIRGDYIRLENFEVTNIGDDTGGFDLTGTQHVEITNNYIHELNCTYGKWGAIRGSSSYITIKNNTIWRAEGIAIMISGNNWLVEGNDVSHGSNLTWFDKQRVSGDSDAIRFFGRDHVIRGNKIHDYLKSETDGSPHMDCFQTYSVNSGEYAQYILIENNYCNNISSQMFMGEDSATENNVHHITFRNNIFKSVGNIAINVHSVDYFTFENNVVTEAGYEAIRLIDGSHHAKVLNNIFYNNYRNDPDNPRGQMLTEEESKVGSVWDYNIHYPDFSYPAKQPEYDQHGIYGVDPMFVNPNLGNFMLEQNSPAIDIGCTITDFSYDINGIQRPQGDRWDVGAYEFLQGGNAPNSPTKLRLVEIE